MENVFLETQQHKNAQSPFYGKDAYQKLIEHQNKRVLAEKPEFLIPSNAAMFGLMVRLRDLKPDPIKMQKLAARKQLAE